LPDVAYAGVLVVHVDSGFVVHALLFMQKGLQQRATAQSLHAQVDG
jgi:hypothetical protein